MMSIDDYHPLLWFADLVALLSLLPPRGKAQALSRLAENIRQLLATEPDKEIIPPWLINRMFGVEIFDLPQRHWRGLPDPETAPELCITECRILGRD